LNILLKKDYLKVISLFLIIMFKEKSLDDIHEWVHFSCTSEDINNLANSLMQKEASEKVLLPRIN